MRKISAMCESFDPAGFRAFRECNDSLHARCKHSCCYYVNRNIRCAQCSSLCSFFALYSFSEMVHLEFCDSVHAECIQR